MQGKVKWFSEDKGYGYIVSDHGQDHYFHVRDVLGADLPQNGNRVGFEPIQHQKGTRATLVSVMPNTEHISSIQNNDARIICIKCDKKMTPRLWHYAPLLGKAKNMRHMKTQHLCPYCGSCQYESGGEMSLYGKLILVMFAGIFLIGILGAIFS